MAGHRNINVLREKMGPKRATKAKARAKEIQVEMLCCPSNQHSSLLTAPTDFTSVER